MTDYLNSDKIYPDDISRRIDTPQGFDSAQQVSANQSEKTPQDSPELFPDCLQQLENDSTICREKRTQNATKVVTLTTLNEPDRDDLAK